MALLLRNTALGPTQRSKGVHGYFRTAYFSNPSYSTIRKPCAIRRQIEKVTLRPKGWGAAEVYFLGACRFKLHWVQEVSGRKEGKMLASIYKERVLACPGS